MMLYFLVPKVEDHNIERVRGIKKARKVEKIVKKIR